MAELSQSVEATTGTTTPEDLGAATVVEITEGQNPKMEGIKDVADDVSLAEIGKPEDGHTVEVNDYTDVNGDGPKESEDHGERKEKQKDILGLEGEQDKNGTSKKEGSQVYQIKKSEDAKAYRMMTEAGNPEGKEVNFEKLKDVKYNGKIKNKEADNDVEIDDGDKVEEKKYKGKKHSKKLDDTVQLEDVVDDENEENEEHNAEGTVLEKLEEQDVKDEPDAEKDQMEEEADMDNGKNRAVDSDVEKGSKRKRSLDKRDRESEEKKKNRRKILNEEPTTPGIFADRPVRERKTVVRLVEVIEKEQGEGIRIVKGRGIPLKDIPNVAYKLSRRKPEDIKLLHVILFGRKGKATDFKSHISQFSGFVWPENEEKQKTKVKEKLDKCARPKLLDLCDLFDIPVSKTAAKKEDVVEKLLDFLIAPHPTTDVIYSEKEQHSSLKRKRSSGGSLPGTVGSANAKALKKRRTGSSIEDSVDTGAAHSEEKDEKGGEEDKGRRGNDLFTMDEDSDHSTSEKENNSIKDADSEDFTFPKKKESKNDKYRSTKKSPLLEKSPSLLSGNGAKKIDLKYTKPEETHKSGPKVFSRRKKFDDTLKEGSSNLDSRVKDIGRKLGTSKSKSDKADKTEPTKAELRKMISLILKEVDFNTATFKDILKQLGTRFTTDLTHMKEEIKVMTKEELVKIAEEEANSDDEVEASDEEENAQTAAKKIRT